MRGVTLEWVPDPHMPTPDVRSGRHAPGHAQRRDQRHRRVRQGRAGARHHPHRTTRRSSRLLRIVVEDNGEGIAPEDLTKIFSVFESRKGSRGTGLGLPVSQKILHEHDGDISVESTPQQGSRFCLSMPAVSPEAAAEDPAADAARTTFVSDRPTPPQ